MANFRIAAAHILGRPHQSGGKKIIFLDKMGPAQLRRPLGMDYYSFCVSVRMALSRPKSTPATGQTAQLVAQALRAKLQPR